MKKHLMDKPDINNPIILTDADVAGEGRCVTEWIDCIEGENGALICKTIKNNCLYEALHEKKIRT